MLYPSKLKDSSTDHKLQQLEHYPRFIVKLLRSVNLVESEITVEHFLTAFGNCLMNNKIALTKHFGKLKNVTRNFIHFLSEWLYSNSSLAKCGNQS